LIDSVSARQADVPSHVEQDVQLSQSLRGSQKLSAVPETSRGLSTQGGADPGNSWESLIAELDLAGLVRELASHCEIAEQSASKLVLRVSSTHNHLLSKANQDKLKSALQERLKNCELSFSLGEPLSETPAQRLGRVNRDAGARAVESIDQDLLLIELTERLDATLLVASVKPAIS
jgi:DNA polymerase III subunit gamma/tau